MQFVTGLILSLLASTAVASNNEAVSCSAYCQVSTEGGPVDFVLVTADGPTYGKTFKKIFEECKKKSGKLFVYPVATLYASVEKSCKENPRKPG